MNNDNNQIIRIVLVLLLIAMVLYLMSELKQPETPPKIENKKKRVKFNEKVKIKEIPNRDKTSYITENDITPILPQNTSIYDDYEDESWETAFQGTLLDDKTKKIQNKINNDNQTYRDYNLDHNLIMHLDTTIPYYPKTFDKKETQGKTIKSIYDNKVANIVALPKEIKYQTNERWIYKDESTLNGGKMNKKGLTGNDDTVMYTGSSKNLHNPKKISYEDEFIMDNDDPFIGSSERRII
jgi:hypothetical protein